MRGFGHTFVQVQVDASYENRVMVAATYDVCYCDENCLNSAYWFKAPSLHPIMSGIGIRVSQSAHGGWHVGRGAC